MNAIDSTAQEIARYLNEVREALADLPVSERDELLEDLPDHLAEVAAESGRPLAERLGSPAEYAAELRAAAGLDPRRQGSRPLMDGALRRVRRACLTLDTRLGPVVGYPRLRDFLVLLRPGWWLLRGYLACLVLLAMLSGDSNGLVPRVGGSRLAGLIILVVIVIASIWLGRRTPTAKRWQRRLVGVVGGFVALAGLVIAMEIDGNARQSYQPVSDPYSWIVDLYPYGPDGQPLQGVRLYNQDGSPVQVGNPWRCAQPTGLPVEPSYAYPLCGVAYPWASVGPVPSDASAAPTRSGAPAAPSASPAAPTAQTANAGASPATTPAPPSS